MKNTTILLLLLSLLFACRKDDPAAELSVCGVKDPARNLPWLRDIIKEAKRKNEENITTISLVEVRGQPIINYYVSYLSCIGCLSYYCDGSRVDLSTFTQAELRDYQDNLWTESGKRVVLWPRK
ncbi:hypothetical protein GCM10027275_48800 [Rhabdobacter roseus]|uniref:Lipoprotein n=1 Tax=Rhabdobacter roseus TaxID=1655419 RepID=A0A840TUM5_9BACT|nr:hypothetical protein [Rhabdobacter roseus]MBB5286944.1 hypothetical protein [Rhabdobacter roseus]